jgi:SGS domain
MSTKIEVILRKQAPGQKWSALEAPTSSETLAVRPVAGDPATATAAPTSVGMSTSASSQAGPVYPTSSRRGAKDWDKVAVELTSKKKNKPKSSKGKVKETDASEDKGAESDGAESIDSDYGAGDPVDAFFKKLYANADPDTRRAMVKSYYESQGTALSTNWDEVSKGTVEARPPSD